MNTYRTLIGLVNSTNNTDMTVWVRHQNKMFLLMLKSEPNLNVNDTIGVVAEFRKGRVNFLNAIILDESNLFEHFSKKSIDEILKS